MSEQKENNSTPAKKHVSIEEPVKEEKPSKMKAAKDAIPEELSEEDKALKEGLELAVTRLEEGDVNLHKPALDHLSNEIRTSTSSMTAVPKPLKYLRPHYETLKRVYSEWPASHDLKNALADVLSVLAMTMGNKETRESLQFKLQGTVVNVSSWGHEYVRSLAGEVSEEYNQRNIESASTDADAFVDDLMAIVDDIVPFQMSHNAEAEAVDLLLEVQQLQKLVEMNVVDERNCNRVCLYLLRCADFTADPDDLQSLFDTAFQLYKIQKQFTDALRVAIRLDDTAKISSLFADNSGNIDLSVKRQMALVLGRQRSSFVLESDDSEAAEELNGLIGNVTLSDRFLAVGVKMDVADPKAPEDIYKTSSSAGAGGRNRRNPLMHNANPSAADSAKANLASTFVNGFVNAGFCKDKLMTADASEITGTGTAGSWVFKNKDHGMASAVASLGLILMWNVDEGFNQIDKYFHHSEEWVKVGACLGVGIVSSGARNESDPALAILADYLSNRSHNIRMAAIIGLGIAYAGARRDEVTELLLPILCLSHAEGANMAEVSMAALALGLVFVGSCNDELAQTMAQRLMEATEEELGHDLTRFLCLGLGLVYLGKGERADLMLEVVRTVEHTIGKYADITLETCAYAGSGNVLKVQQLLRSCAEHLTENAAHQSAAVLGIALLSAGEDQVGAEMTVRTLEHLLHYCELPVKRVVPLALALLYPSHPEYSVVDTLSRLSHDQDPELAQNACLALGIVSAGTNNSRVSGLLRQLAEFYSKDAADHLFMVRIAQGLNAMGKGLLGLSPFHSDRLLTVGPSLAGLLVVLHSALDLKKTLLSQYHYFLYFLAPAMNPRFLTVVDEALNPLDINVRVGQAVEIVGQAGRPRAISGFQTHTAPVLLGPKDRAELANKEYLPLTSVIEYVVIAKPAPTEEVGGTESPPAAASAGGL